MKQEEKKNRNRRTNEQLDRDVMSELEKLVAEQGFGNVNLSTLTKAAGMEANVFYRRYGSMDNLYDRLAKQYDFWMNNAIDISNLNVLGPKKFFAETFKTLF
ncbi:TetR/AcrR family transcriptional regulator, partial [Bacteroides uniformis]